jgi:mannose-6-phosphate isomerase-like protein (cupin superfamily)
MTQLTGYIQKGWGYEVIWATNADYCGKILCFNKVGNRTSLHFHKEKSKSWFINSGQFKLKFIDVQTTELKEVILKEGDTFNMMPLVPHQLESMADNSMIFEVSTKDTVEDNYKIAPGDSQKMEVSKDGKNDVSS